MTNSLKALGGLGAFFSLFPLISSLSPNKKILLDNTPLQVDISSLQPGQKMTVEWRGKPIWILYRTNSMLKHLNGDSNALRDPNSAVRQQPDFARNKFRSKNPNYIVLVGLCTHLGCSPKLQVCGKGSEPNCFYCPCHGSRFDLSGRVYKGVPAVTNLEVPPYKFLGEDVLVIGEV